MSKYDESYLRILLNHVHYSYIIPKFKHPYIITVTSFSYLKKIYTVIYIDKTVY